jgi:8-oxo-dGTP pyrophosphatase MutT (NUDIX family)
MTENSTEITRLDDEAIQVCTKQDWNLAAFIALFDEPLEEVLMVQLGDYARPTYRGNPWTLPGGSVDPLERPSLGVCREVEEETRIAIKPHSLRPVGWFQRPNHKPHHRLQVGELLIVYGAVVDRVVCCPKHRPPETIALKFIRFDPEELLLVPSSGEGEHPLQPLPRHWVYWAWLAKLALRSNVYPLHKWEYSTTASLSSAPWQDLHGNIQ